MEDGLKAKAAQKAASLLDDLRCPEHERAADVVVADDSSGVTFGFCCARMKELAGERLREKGARPSGHGGNSEQTASLPIEPAEGKPDDIQTA